MFLPVSRVLLIALLLVATSLSGCATGGYSIGRDFNSAAVSQIVKGKTTKDDVVRMFGEPFSKQVASENEEKWMYVYDAGVVKAQSYVFTTVAQVTGQKKTLDILLRNGIVINYTYLEGQPEVKHEMKTW